MILTRRVPQRRAKGQRVTRIVLPALNAGLSHDAPSRHEPPPPWPFPINLLTGNLITLIMAHYD